LNDTVRPPSSVSEAPPGPAWLEAMHSIYRDADRAPAAGPSAIGRLGRACSLALRAARGWEARHLLPELAVICAMIGVIWINAGLLVHEEYADAERHALGETGNLARAFQESVAQTVSGIDQALLSVRAFHAFLGERFDMAEWERTQSRLGSLTAGVHLVDAHGNLFASTLPMPPVPVNVADREHFVVQANDTEDELHISKLVTGLQTGKETVQFTRRLMGPDGAFGGIAVVSLDPNELSRSFGTLQLGEGFVALLSQDGTILARGPFVAGAIGTSIADQPYFAAMRSKTSGVVRTTGRGDAEQIISFRKLDAYPLLVLVGDDAPVVFANYFLVRRNALFASSAATVIVILAGAFWIGLRRRSLAAQRALGVTLENISQGIVMVDNEGRIPVINRRAVDLLRLPASVAAAGRLDPHSADPAFAETGVLAFPFSSASEGGLSAVRDLPASFDACLDNGSIVEVRTHRLPTGGMVQTFSDVTEQRQAGEHLLFMAHHDSVTGLPNRFMFKERLETEITRIGLYGRMAAVVMIDLDGFKSVNDTMGHDAGDQLLKSVAARLLSLVRRDDIVARFGGDEFVILQTDLSRADMAEGLAQRLIAHLSEATMIGGQQVRIGASVGLAVYPLDGRDSETLLKHADIALYRAKTEGRGTFRRFDHWMTRPLQERRAMENDLRRAVEASELDLHFQPQFATETLLVTGFEALVRWAHRERGFVPPATFIAVAEACGLIGQIGSWVLERACSEAVGWGIPCRVAVNVSPLQLKDTGFRQFVADVLARSGLPPALLEIEVTEGVLIEEDEQVLGALRDLKSLGVRLTLDDFGTGYSSLGYLLRLPFDKIKIDKSFVQSTDFGARAILEAILVMGRRLELDVVAEGVETKEQLAMIRQQHCAEIQGFLLAMPMPADKVGAYLRDYVAPTEFCP
jgi:diguanylate cyclase (GGDEF)-like protein